MAKSQPVNYVRVAEVLTELGMVTRETAQNVIDQFGDLAYGGMEPGHEIASSLESFGVAVCIHAEDVDFADHHYEWLLAEAAALTGGKVTVDNFRFDKEDPDDEDAGRGTMYFQRNGKELSFSVEQESNDYLDMSAAQGAIEALSPDDDPRTFRCVDSGPYTLGYDDVMVLATAEQREGLFQHLGITFREPW
ncbi:hypothetical protein SBI_08308 [Streptomyces bingchenggensis BCW-1]|uniref:Uncharacterized protein n=1 Tax=Streptomyces bingchenggensis (strain BCW-1) TaxID=749414 RepID=D7BR76_STRBB|nr:MULTISPECIES: hypothetical protein [Streptomyces]ADI11426.1 hypothetical protein SBI_08308 [Streptomyces bingchenggensis BCW-1]